MKLTRSAPVRDRGPCRLSQGSTDLSERASMPTGTNVRLTSFAPQFLVDGLPRSIAYYEKIGFRLGEPWDGFYAIGHRDGLEVHLKEAPKDQAERRWRRENEH